MDVARVPKGRKCGKSLVTFNKVLNRLKSNNTETKYPPLDENLQDVVFSPRNLN